MDIDYNWIRISKNILIIITFLNLITYFLMFPEYYLADTVDRYIFQVNNFIDLFIIDAHTKKYKKENDQIRTSSN